MTLIQNNIFANRYRLEERLGAGGFGEVWKAYDNVTKQHFAIKIHLKGDGERAAQEIVKEYTRVMHIHHDNLLTPSHVDIADGNVPYLVMELCEFDLTDRDLTETEVWQLIRDVSAGLKRLAENKRKRTRSDGSVVEVSDPVIHQDIKPANILLRSNGMYAISDFGISKRRLSSLSTNDATQMQDMDSAMTIDYAAPERFPRGKGVAVLASDIWSLGAMLFEIVEGRRPFAECGGDCLNPTIGLKIPTIKREGYSEELKELIYDCMAKTPADRPTAAQLFDYSDKALKNLPRKKSWTGTPSETKVDQTKQQLPEPQVPSKPKPEPKSNQKKGLLKKITPIVMLSFIGIGMIWMIVKKIHSSSEPILNYGTDTSGISIAQDRIPNNFVLCPQGTLLHYKDWDRKKQEYVYIDVPLDSFYIAQYELTQKEWNEIMPEYTDHLYVSLNPYREQHLKGDSLPANSMGFFHACIYCNRRSRKEGYSGFYSVQNGIITFNPDGNGYRLPNIYEWAYAARGGERKTTKYAAGDNLNEIAWYGGNSGGRPHNVGQKKPNSIGLYDMNGNVGESLWPIGNESKGCPIWYHPSSYSVYIGFAEDEGWCGSDGIRLVFVPKGIKNNNIQCTMLENMKVSDTLAVLF